MSNATAVTDETFETEVEKANGLTVVDFWATWCAPCRMIAPIVRDLAVEYAGRATMASLDIEANPRTMLRYGVRALPTLLVFRDGRVVDQIVGAVPRARIEAKLREHLAPGVAA
jgi:thioredoxin 1